VFEIGPRPGVRSW